MSFSLEEGSTPLLVSMPHAGTRIPVDQRPRYVDRALDVEDTDWHLEELYDFVQANGASTMVPNFSRYLIDLNRPPDDSPMYAGVNTTELCPTRFFNGEDLYKPGMAPDAAEIARRLEKYWQPYHAALAEEINRIKGEFGYALLFDAHSIRSEIPWLFEGRLPDLNLGTADGTSCAASLRDTVAQCLIDQSRYTHAVDGRFKGGYITRHYGNPAAGVHSLQLEICQCLYMDESPPHDFRPDLADNLRPVLQSVIDAMLNWQPDEG